MSQIGAQQTLSENHTREAWELLGRDMIRTKDSRQIVAQFWTSPSAADARLMVAAPAMLEALRHAEAILSYAPEMSTNKNGAGPSTSTHRALELVRAALKEKNNG